MTDPRKTARPVEGLDPALSPVDEGVQQDEGPRSNVLLIHRLQYHQDLVEFK
jgi:hypothetical protein